MITLLLCAGLLLKIVWADNMEFTPKETKLINLRHNLVSALNTKLSRKQRQTVANELELLLEKF